MDHSAQKFNQRCFARHSRPPCVKFPERSTRDCPVVTMRQAIDLNCDLGEGMACDEALLALVSSANIACGGHAGDGETMTNCIRRASALSLAIGAHPGYCDPEHFGRRALTLPMSEIEDLLTKQITRLCDIAARENTRVDHVRVHGALGNLTDANDIAAETLASLLAQAFPTMALMTLGGSASEKAARAHGLPVIRQFFADRAYDRQGQLVSRQLDGSVLHDSAFIVERLLRALDSGQLASIDGHVIKVEFDTVCLHGDSPGALALAEDIRTQLEHNGIAVQAYNRQLEGSRL